MGKLDNVKDLQVVSLAIQHIDRIEDFLRENIQKGDPILEVLLSQQDEAYEGSHLELAIHQLARLCVVENQLKGVSPCALAAVGNNKIIAICFGTRGVFPHNLLAKPVKGKYANAYGNLLQRMESQMNESMGDKMEGEVVQINRLLVVDQQYRQSGLGTFLIRHSIEDALRSGCAAYFYPACGVAQKCADKLKLTCQNAMDVSEEDKLLANVADYGRLMKGYLTLFKKFETDENDGMPTLE